MTATWSNPALFSSGQAAGVSANLDLMVNNQLVFGQGWQPYSPVWTAATTNPTAYTSTGAYAQAGKMVWYRGNVGWASGTSTMGSGNYSMSLPVAVATLESNTPIGILWVRNSTGGDDFSGFWLTSPGSSTVQARGFVNAQNYVWSPTQPYANTSTTGFAQWNVCYESV